MALKGTYSAKPNDITKDWFVVDADGFVGNIEILRGIGAGCDEEALKVVKAMPKWEPGYQNNRAVPVIYNMPIRFALLDN